MTPLATARTTAEIAEHVGAVLDGPAELLIHGFDFIEQASPGSMTFIRSPKFAQLWKGSHASAALVSKGVTIADHDPTRRALLYVDDADLALVKVLNLVESTETAHRAGVDPLASVHPDAEISPSARIGPNCTIESEARIGESANLVANVFVGRGASIGRNTTLMPGVVVMHACSIGDRCTIHATSVIGADGFGYTPAPDGSSLVKIPHPGGVRIHDDVEIGACTTIDRAKLGDTIVGQGTKIDNHVQVGHGCRIGRCCVICGSTGISGSVTIGDGVQIGGGVGIADNVNIGDGARIGANSGVHKDIPPGERWFGMPAARTSEQLNNYAAFRHLAELARDVKRLKNAAQRSTQDNAGHDTSTS